MIFVLKTPIFVYFFTLKPLDKFDFNVLVNLIYYPGGRFFRHLTRKANPKIVQNQQKMNEIFYILTDCTKSKIFLAIFPAYLKKGVQVEKSKKTFVNLAFSAKICYNKVFASLAPAF